MGDHTTTTDSAFLSELLLKKLPVGVSSSGYVRPDVSNPQSYLWSILPVTRDPCCPQLSVPVTLRPPPVVAATRDSYQSLLTVCLQSL